LYENFNNLAPEQREKILNACIEEFATHGYAGASTNVIVKRANIPKGTLFYFFGSKKDLYLYILDHAVDRYVQQFMQDADELPSDLFERLLYIHKKRMQFALSQPLLFRLFYNAFINTDENLKSDLEARYQAYATGSQGLMTQGLDRSRLKDGVDVDKAVEMIVLIMEGWLSRHLPDLKETSPQESLALIDKLSRESQDYFTMIRNGIYR
jgi:TetR/AcrR family transcriptional regulator